MSNMKKYKALKENNRVSFSMLYYSMNRTIKKIEKLIKYDCKMKNIPESKYKIYIRLLRKKNDQMASKYKSMN